MSSLMEVIANVSAGADTRANTASGGGEFLVELDNYDCSDHPGIQDPNDLSHPFGWVVCFPAAACDSVTPACLVCISNVSRYVYVTHFNHTPGFSFLFNS